MSSDQREQPPSGRPSAHAGEPRISAAKLLVVLLAFAWGLNWIAAAVALREMSPWSLRVAGSGIGAVTLLGAAFISGQNLRVPRGEHIHIMIAGFFNVAAFQILSGFAQLSGATSRAIIITYSMPIWASALAWLILGDRLDRVRIIALALCIAGLGVLIWPLVGSGAPLGVFFAFGCAFGWALATVYLKWAKVDVDPLVNAAWQLAFGTALLAVGMFMFDGYPRIWPISNTSVVAILYIGIFGVGLAHFLWWTIVGKLPTITASIGSLLVPVVAIIASTIMLGERPTMTDIVGFASIFAAAACVLLQPGIKHDEMPE